MLAREPFHDNRKRVGRAKGKQLMRRRGERIERTFALACETGAHRRVRLRGKENVKKRYVAHIAALNLGLVMRAVFGHGTPRQAAAATLVWVLMALRAWGRRASVSLGRPLGTILRRPLDACCAPAWAA